MSIDLEPAKLLSLHSLTKDIAQASARRLKTQIDAMAPLFRPRRFLGDHIDSTSKESAAGADRNLAELQELYARVAIKPFDLRPELRKPLESVSTQFQLDEWEYTHATPSDHGWNSIRVTTPLTWVLSYATSYSLGSLRGVVTGVAQRDPEAVRAFVLRACLMFELFEKIPAIKTLFESLRYQVEVRRSPQLGELPLITISAPFKTFRPSDDLVATAAGLAGGASFTEILDLESIRNLSDPLRDEASAILSRHKVEI